MDTATGEVISRGGEGGRCRVIKEEIESSQSAFLALVAFVHQRGTLKSIQSLSIFQKFYPS